jgi:hypothetical protein
MTVAVAADTSVRLTRAQFDLAADLTKSQPLAWGRYFNGYHTTAAEYRPQEAGLFEALRLRLLPVAQQTPKVGGTALDGASNAALNVYKFIERIGLEHLAASGTEYLMFLDVEGDQQGNPSLSAAYYTGWSQTLIAASRDQSNRRFTILPAVYGRSRDTTTWQALRDAEANGAEPCRGVWVTRQHFDACTKPRPDWETTFLTPEVPLSCPVYVWQYAIDCPTGDGVDLDLLNPDDALREELLKRLVVPGV